MDEVETYVVRARDGDLAAFETLVRRFQDMAYGYAFSILGDFHLAQDAAQEAFIEAYRDLPALREAAAFPGWFRRIVFKQCDRIVRKRRVQEVSLEHAAEVVSPALHAAGLAEKQEMLDQVLEAIRALPEHERTATSLYYINGYSHKEIAEFLGIAEKTVKSRVHSSRRRLKERMLDMVDSTMKSKPLPTNFPETVVRLVASERDLEEARKLLETSYHGKRNPEMFSSVAAAQAERIYIVMGQDAVGGAGWYDEVDWSIGSTVMRAVRTREMGMEAQGVPHPDFVRGYQGCFHMAREKGRCLAVVHGSMYDHGFCGFVPCFYHPVASLDLEVAKTVSSSARLREVNDEEEQREGWRRFLLDPYAAKIGGMSPGPMTHVVEQAGRPQGFLSVQKDWFGDTVFPSMTVSSRDAALAVLKFVAEQTAGQEVRVYESHMTWVTQTVLSLGGRYLLRPACNLAGLDNEMVAILDLVRLTEALPEEFQRRVRRLHGLGKDIEFSFEMGEQTVAFSLRDGELRVTRENQKVHLTLPRWLVTRLYMGYYSGQDVLEMGPVPWDRSDGKQADDAEKDMKPVTLPEPQAALFAALFPKLWPSSVPDPDVAPWVIGEKHPQYQNEDKKTPESKAQIDALAFPWLFY